MFPTTTTMSNVALIGARFGLDVARAIEALGVAGVRIAAELAWSDDLEGEAAAEEIRIADRRDFAVRVAREMKRQGQDARATTSPSS